MVADHEVNPAVICMKIYTHDGTCVKNQSLILNNLSYKGKIQCNYAEDVK